MGRAMSTEFLGEGARVAAADIRLAAAEETVSWLDDRRRAIAVSVDVAAPESVATCVETVVQWGGCVDVLCNNAGVPDSYAPAHQLELEEWNRVIAVNLTGPFLMARAVIPHMLKRGSGVIINTASISAFSAAAGGTAYTASKHGMLGLTRQLTFDYGANGIRVNAICPGATLTGMTTRPRECEFGPDFEAALARTPAGRWCQPEEVARLAVYLASKDADFIHGAAIVIDGGWLTAAREAF
jgi:NAD(P)-dependent dehydrogenase (short-subunit alcohol dehydrogenase family)